MRRGLMLLALTAMLCAPAHASAQAVELRVGHWSPSAKDLAPGFGLAAAYPIGTRLLLEAHAQTGSVPREGVMCAGLIMPGAYCPTEPIEVSTRAGDVTLAYRAPLLPEMPRWSVDGRVGAGLAVTRTVQTGTYTGRRWHDIGPFLLLELGLHAEHQLFAASPLRAAAAGRVGLAWRPSLQCSDCRISSFNNGGYSLGGIEIGLAWPLGAGGNGH